MSFKADNAILPPKQGQILVQVRAASINPVDYKKISIPVMNWGLDGKPVSQDFAGVVIDSGGCDRFQPGDSVYGNAGGCMADRIWVSETDIALKPKSMTYLQASSLPTTALTSYQALIAGGAKEGSKVVVVGASGGCGLAGIMIARSIVGAEGKVVAICGTHNIEYIKSLGVVDDVLDYKHPDTIQSSSSILAESKPFDMVYDTVTSPDPGDSLDGKPYDEVLRPYLKKDGYICAINGSAGRWVGALTGWQGKGYKLLLKSRSGKQLTELAAMAEAGALKAVIDSTHPFTEDGVRAAFDRVKSRRSVGKVVVDIQDGDSVQ